MCSAPNLHGDDVQQSAIALLIIDVINDLDFPEGKDLLRHALPMASRIKELRQRADDAGIPVIYANDNFGKWRSDFRAQIQHCLQDDVCGQPLVKLLEPGSDHYFVLKPRHSAFYSTALELLLRQLGVKSVILTGIAGNNCILFTANDAYLRELKVIVPADCVASNTPEDNRYALELMQKVLKADTRPSTEWTHKRLEELAANQEI